jgi:hypothetical protein
MDILRLEVRKLQEPALGETEEVAIFINGQDLVEILREYEMPFAQREGSMLIAGGYAGLPPKDALPPSRHFLGEPSWELYRDGDRVSVLECTCGVPGCWPFMGRITVEEDTVIWGDFEQPHRREGHPNGEWSYPGLGPFVFECEQYLQALDEPAVHKQEHARDTE